MAKLRCNSTNDSVLNQLEWEGTPQELLAIYDGLKERLGNALRKEDIVPHQYDPRPKSITEPRLRSITELVFGLPNDYSELAKKMPSVDQLIEYILGKPRFEHDIVDIGKKFFGKQVNSRQYEKLYRELRTKLEFARKSIEASQGGAFERKPTPSRNLPAYTFKKINATSLDISSQKIS